MTKREINLMAFNGHLYYPDPKGLGDLRVIRARTRYGMDEVLVLQAEPRWISADLDKVEAR